LVSAGDREKRILLKDKEVEVETDNSSAFLINKNGEGYYITMYDGELLRIMKTSFSREKSANLNS
jgi:hypothetical protein